MEDNKLNEAKTEELYMPTQDEFNILAQRKAFYENNYALIKAGDKKYCKGKHWPDMPWAIGYGLSQKDRSVPKAIRYWIVSMYIDWADLEKEVSRACHTLGVKKDHIVNILDKVVDPNDAKLQEMANTALSYADQNPIEECLGHEEDDLVEGTEKVADHKWVNKGDDGTHGEFKTKKAADAQRKAMFANGFHEDVDIEENIEKHDELNPKLFENEKLKPEVKEKINELVELFKEQLKESDIDIDIKDIVLIGSNASYNYTDDSDLDVHIIAGKVDDKQAKIYDLCKSNFNSKIKPNYYGIPVEVYVETEGAPRVSNGCYSVMNDEWVNKPNKDNIPEPDQKAIDDKVEPWEVRYNNLLDEIKVYLGKDTSADDIDDETDDNITSVSDAMDAFSDEAPLTEDLNAKPIADIEKFIDDVYALRKAGMEGEGEYDENNLIFKEIRNRGYLDNLKELKNKVISKELSVEDAAGYVAGPMPEPMDKTEEEMPADDAATDEIEEAYDGLNDRDIYYYRTKIQQLTRYQPLVDRRGNFEIYQVNQNDVDQVVRNLRSQMFVDRVSSAAGAFDFNHFNNIGQPQRKYTVRGQIHKA